MRFSNALAYVPARLRLFWDRVTTSKITIVYFVFSVLHCIIQLVFQIQAFTINDNAVNFLSDLIAQGNSTKPGFAVPGPDLRWCTSVPNKVDASSCSVIWQGINNAANAEAQTVAGVLSNVNSALQDNVPSVASVAVSSSSLSFASSTQVSSSAYLITPSTSSELSVALLSSAIPSAVVPSALSSVSSSSAAVSSFPSISGAEPSASLSTSVEIVAPASSTSASVRTVIVQPSTSSAPEAATSTSVQTLTVVAKPTPNAADSEGLLGLLRGRGSGDIQHSKRHISVFASTGSDGKAQVNIDGLTGQDEVTLNSTCLMALNWPVAMVENTKREDIVFICFQVWVLGMSLVAILNESIPHIFASLFTHILATAWGGFQIANTKQFRAEFLRITLQGPCGVNLLPDYWQGRARAELPSLALNAVALVMSAFLTWKLVKLFGWQTFKRVGASLTIRRIYNAVLVLSIVIQLSAFFIVVSGGLWIDQVYHGSIAKYTHKPTAMKAVVILVILLLFPWLVLGWVCVRREYKKRMLVFLALAFLYLVGWSAMFASNTFRWTFVQWRFFSLMASASVVLTTLTFALGLYCRVNFGKGLPRYLNTQRGSEDDFAPISSDSYFNEKKRYDDAERVAFPPEDDPVPTYTATFGPDEPAPAHVGRVLGPRFFAAPPASYESTSTLSGGIVSPPMAYGAAPAYQQSKMTLSSGYPSYSTAAHSAEPLTRHGSGASQHSISSTSSGSSQQPRTKRWIIE